MGPNAEHKSASEATPGGDPRHVLFVPLRNGLWTIEDRVQAINHCGDTYKVTTADGMARYFWERNLLIKTDVSDDGPARGAPAIAAAPCCSQSAQKSATSFSASRFLEPFGRPAWSAVARSQRAPTLSLRRGAI
jgi:hypothetical protein